MQKLRISKRLIQVLTVLLVSITAFSFTSRFGLDSYEIYLNDNLILKQYVNQPLNLRVLDLGKADDNDLLKIKYKHCINKGVGSDRSIVLKDEKGAIVKKWVFADGEANMVIPVKELIRLEKAYNQQDLSLFYSAKELTNGEMLSTINFKG